MKTVLVTGFEPFGGDERNPSAEIARALAGRVIGGHRIVAAELACVFGESLRQMRVLLKRHEPRLVIGLGLAAGRLDITPERVAINVDDARIPDNRGAQPVDRPIVRGAPAAYWSTLPVKAIVAALRKREVPASVSQTAGTFVCNHVFYGLMHGLRHKRAVRGGFVHVPWPADWPGTARSGIPFEDMVDGIELAIKVALRTRRDARTRGGAIA